MVRRRPLVTRILYLSTPFHVTKSRTRRPIPRVSPQHPAEANSRIDEPLLRTEHQAQGEKRLLHVPAAAPGRHAETRLGVVQAPLPRQEPAHVKVIGRVVRV